MASLLGTPDEDVWPGVTTLPDFKPSFPAWRPKNLGSQVSGLTPESAELLEVRAVCALAMQTSRMRS